MHIYKIHNINTVCVIFFPLSSSWRDEMPTMKCRDICRRLHRRHIVNSIGVVMLIGLMIEIKLMTIVFTDTQYPVRYGQNSITPCQEDPHIKFLSCPDLHGEDSDTILVFVPSRAEEYNRRMMIRQTWANTTNYSKHNGKKPVIFIFSIGLTCNDSDISNCRTDERILQEVKHHEDILLLNISDTYDNLVHKVRLSMEWISLYSKAGFIFKVDSDVIPNIFLWGKIIENLLQAKASCFLMGFVVSGGRPIRNNSLQVMENNGRLRKFIVSQEEYDGENYPNYCNGPGYVMSRDAMTAILEVTSRTPVFKFEDIYLTGLSVSQTNVHLLKIPSKSFPNFSYMPIPDNINVILNKLNYTLMIHQVPESRWMQIWNRIKSYQYDKIDRKAIHLKDRTSVNVAIPQRWTLRSKIHSSCTYKNIDLKNIWQY